ncbi:MAG: archease [Candidatus Diapherotrites archaeon]
MHETFKHQADVGVRGRGKTLEDAFEGAAKAMFSVMVELQEVNPEIEVKFAAVGEDRESLLINFLNELLFQIDVNHMLFSEFGVKSIEKKNGEFYLKGSAKGEKISERHNIRTGVKAASYSQVFVGEKDGEFVAQCIVDV